MSAVSHGGLGLLDLEKELTCSICTDLLYQPLTLLDCLHSFCGFCLKEWFATQASRRRSSTSTPQFTCPACRAMVRETRPNATVTTLLDMLLAASPRHVKSVEEKEEIARRYKPGDPVLPAELELDGVSDEEERRLVEEVRELSLREARNGGSAARRTGVDAEVRRGDGRSRRRRDEERGARRIEHQSSLRSLLSLSDTEMMEAEILRQILEDGLLNDIDLDTLGPAGEEELTERIADAYRRRHMRRPRSRQRQVPDETPRTTTAAATARPRSRQRQVPDETPRTTATTARPRARSQSVHVQRPPPTPSAPLASSRNPPVSRPYLLEPLVPRSGALRHQRHLSEQGSRRRTTSPVPTNAASTSEVTLRPAARSSSDMVSDRPRPSQSLRSRPAEVSVAPRRRRTTASEQSVPNIFTSEPRSRDHRPGRPRNNSPTSVASSAAPGSASSARFEQPPACSSLAPAVNSSVNQRSRPSSSRSNASQLPPTAFVEPSIACDRCGKQNIQYDLHKRCLQCKGGMFHLCLRCYRLGRGCLQWAGFGASAEADFERMITSSVGSTPPSREEAHVLQSFKYLRPGHRVVCEGREMINDDPAGRLQGGLFCDICHSSANRCYWRCNQCNEGDWGFCNKCVNQGRCCTHALLPICRVPENRSSMPSATNPADGPPAETFKVLSFSTKCDVCAYPIPASGTRFHCLECNEGDYDVCANCYFKLVATAKISKENGHSGWRRCLKGHRMIVVGFERHDEGQRRVIVRDLVGGRALKDEHLALPSSSTAHVPRPPVPDGPTTIPSPEFGTGDWSWKEGAERRKKASRMRTPWTNTTAETTNPHPHPHPHPSTPTSTSLRRFPPDGGIGLVAHAVWSWYPEHGVADELMFPRGAEITEAENINDDWFWGCYAGQTGLFPGAHVDVVGEVV